MEDRACCRAATPPTHPEAPGADGAAIRRRDFLRAAAIGGLAATPFVQACVRGRATIPGTATPPAAARAAPSPELPPTSPARVTPEPEPSAAPAPSPTVEEEAGLASVALVKTRDRAEGVRRAIALLGLNPVRGRKVLLKPNFNSADPTPGSTHPSVLKALVEALREMGAAAITVADRSGMGATRETMERLGIFEMARQLGFDTLVLDELEADEWVMLEPPGSHWRQGFPFARPCLEAEALVQTCCVKTHRFGGHFTLSLKNSVGMVAKTVPGEPYNYMQELHSSRAQRLMIAEINTAYTPGLVVVDGVEAFVAGGPDSGKKVWAEVVLAGTDRVALDAVGVALLRHCGATGVVAEGPIFDQEQIARAVELGLGVDSPGKIRVVTGDRESEAYANRLQALLSS